MHRVNDCRALRDYRLWLRFADGLLGDLLEARGFVRLDPDILHQDLMGSRGMDSRCRGHSRQLNGPRREGRADFVPLNQ